MWESPVTAHPQWNVAEDDILHADAEQVATLRSRLLADQLTVMSRASPRYGALLARVGSVDSATRRGSSAFDVLAELPLTTKADFLRDPESFRLRLGRDDSHEDRALAYLIYTTGTTSGDPAPLYVTTSDDWAYLLHARRCARMLGLGDQEVIANLFPLTPFPMGARIRADRTAAAIGASVVQGHTGRPHHLWPVHRRLDAAIDLMAAHRVTVLWGVAGFVRRLLVRAGERGVALPTVRWCFITGEATSAAGIADLNDRLGSVGAPHARVVNRYGSTEGWSLIPCGDGHGWHNPTPELMMLEVVDPETGATLPDGEVGHLALTHLRTRGTAFLRYVVGDVVAMSREICAGCGRTSERVVTPPVRRSHLLKVNGTLVNVDALADAVRGLRGVVEHRVVLEHRVAGDAMSGDHVVVELAPERGGDVESLMAATTETVRAVAHLTPTVRVVAADDIYAPIRDAKPRRVVDRRVRPD